METYKGAGWKAANQEVCTFLGIKVQMLPGGGGLGQHQGSGGFVAPSGLWAWLAGAGTHLKGRGASGVCGSADQAMATSP